MGFVLVGISGECYIQLFELDFSTFFLLKVLESFSVDQAVFLYVIRSGSNLLRANRIMIITLVAAPHFEG